MQIRVRVGRNRGGVCENTASVGITISAISSRGERNQKRGEMENFSSRMEELLREREELEEGIAAQERRYYSRQQRLQVFSITHERAQEMQEEMEEADRERGRMQRKLKVCEAGMQALEKTAQRIVSEREREWEREIGEMERGVRERKAWIKESRVREALRRGGGRCYRVEEDRRRSASAGASKGDDL
jgi:chromosome segregation ATPase